MTATTITAYECDRCGNRLDVRDDGSAHQYYDWGRITVQQSNGPIKIGRGPVNSLSPMDICPSCIGKLARWWDVRVSKGQSKADTMGGEIEP